MEISELPTLISADAPSTETRLDRAPIGEIGILVGLADDERGDAAVRSALVDHLAAEGLVPGVLLTPERRLPLGGPVVVAIGRARLALGRDIARQLVVRRLPGSAVDGSASVVRTEP